jgi:hypothetical protein
MVSLRDHCVRPHTTSADAVGSSPRAPRPRKREASSLTRARSRGVLCCEVLVFGRDAGAQSTRRNEGKHMTIYSVAALQALPETEPTGFHEEFGLRPCTFSCSESCTYTCGALSCTHTAAVAAEQQSMEAHVIAGQNAYLAQQGQQGQQAQQAQQGQQAPRS